MAAKSKAKNKASKADDGRNESGQDVSSAHMSMGESDEDVGNKPNEIGLHARVGASDDGVVVKKIAWDGGSPKVKATRNKGYEKPVAAFKDISSPTLEELNNFDRTRSFFMLKKDRNINGIITKASMGV